MRMLKKMVTIFLVGFLWGEDTCDIINNDISLLRKNFDKFKEDSEKKREAFFTGMNNFMEAQDIMVPIVQNLKNVSERKDFEILIPGTTCTQINNEIKEKAQRYKQSLIDAQQSFIKALLPYQLAYKDFLSFLDVSQQDVEDYEEQKPGFEESSLYVSKDAANPIDKAVDDKIRDLIEFEKNSLDDFFNKIKDLRNRAHELEEICLGQDFENLVKAIALVDIDQFTHQLAYVPFQIRSISVLPVKMLTLS